MGSSTFAKIKTASFASHGGEQRFEHLGDDHKCATGNNTWQVSLVI
jgi:hypothetical protein